MRASIATMRFAARDIAANIGQPSNALYLKRYRASVPNSTPIARARGLVWHVDSDGDFRDGVHSVHTRLVILLIISPNGHFYIITSIPSVGGWLDPWNALVPDMALVDKVLPLP